MPSLDANSMHSYLGKSISSLNQNKLNGLLAEVDFRNYLSTLGFANQVSPGGWIARREGAGMFGHNTVVVFPEILQVGKNYPSAPNPSIAPQGLHTICATFHQTGVAAYFCSPSIGTTNDPFSVSWTATQLGVPNIQPGTAFPACMSSMFRPRPRKYKFLRYNTNTQSIPPQSLAEEFSKEHLRVTFQTAFLSEMSDVDGIFWGKQFTYPLEIKEKTAAISPRLGPYFGLDLGPFVKLSYYAAKKGNLHSIFVVREINNTTSRNLIDWWFITYDQLAQYASWVPQSGGRSMTGGKSSVVQIPKSEFTRLSSAALASL